MNVSEIKFTLDGAVSPLLHAVGHHPPRSAGCHGSDIWNDLEAEVIYKGKRDPIAQETLRDYGTVGFLWERILERELATLQVEGGGGRWVRPGELELDDIFLTPDYVDLDFYGDGSCILGLEEWKATWRSIDKGNDLERWFWRWLVQQKAYCYALSTLLARLRVLFVVGNWKDQAYPQTRGWEFEFTARELEENWYMLRQHGLAKKWLVDEIKEKIRRGNRKAK